MVAALPVSKYSSIVVGMVTGSTLLTPTNVLASSTAGSSSSSLLAISFIGSSSSTTSRALSRGVYVRGMEEDPGRGPPRAMRCPRGAERCPPVGLPLSAARFSLTSLAALWSPIM